MERTESETLPHLPVNNIFQIYIQKDNLHVPADIERNAFSLKNSYPQANYQLLNDSDLRSFIESHFSKDVLSTYLALVPLAYKADLARYCLMYAYGGIYADLSINLADTFNLNIWQGLGAFRELLVFNKNSWAVCLGLLCAAPHREEFKLAIDMVVENCKSRNYGASPDISRCPKLTAV